MHSMKLWQSNEEIPFKLNFVLNSALKLLFNFVEFLNKLGYLKGDLLKVNAF